MIGMIYVMWASLFVIDSPPIDNGKKADNIFEPISVLDSKTVNGQRWV